MENNLLFMCLSVLIFQCKAEVAEFYQTINNTKQIVNIIKFCTEDRPCLAKCCGLDEVLVVKDSITGCNRTNVKINYSLIEIHDDKTNEKITDKTIPDVFTIVHSDWFMDNDETDAYFLDEDDTLYNTGELDTEKLLPDSRFKIPKLNFCVDIYKGRKPILRYRSVPVPNGNPTFLKLMLSSIAMYISAFLLLINFVIYCILPNLSLMEMIRAAYVACMTLSFTFKASIDLSMTMKNLPSSRIQFIAPVTYFTTLSSFSWLSIMSLDIWWALRGNRKHRKIHNKGIKHKFLMYCIYGFGFPALLTIAAISVDFIKSIPRKFKPNFEDFFGISSADSVFYYLHIPLLILIILNWILFTMTVYNILLVKRGITRLNSTETRSTRENQYRFRIYLKLSLIMGISWIFDVIQSIPAIPFWFRFTMDIYHGLCGIFIFYIFVFETSIITRLEKRLGIKLGRKNTNDAKTASVLTHVSENSKRGQNKKPDITVTDLKTNDDNITNV
ncbi:hypothetical protein K1T71_007650 [Dendrolimus kikuchii]|uniref:Uncharacterized protein n=1 Tax=Dendrolimus kikuchii TaxID=765133 RepID=A0ACC1CXZ8_9NEOP|nr:hypothetical protein K1T71_007650 [Dendrolimus kikuchii]